MRSFLRTYPSGKVVRITYGFKGRVPLSLKFPDVVRDVIRTIMPNPEQFVFEFAVFSDKMFETPFFVGGTRRLFRMLDVPLTHKSYGKLMYRLFPGPATLDLCHRYGVVIMTAPVAYDAALAVNDASEQGEREEDLPDETVIRQQEMKRMRTAYSNVLSFQQRDVLHRRYLHDDDFKTLGEVGKEMGLSFFLYFTYLHLHPRTLPLLRCSKRRLFYCRDLRIQSRELSENGVRDLLFVLFVVCSADKIDTGSREPVAYSQIFESGFVELYTASP